MVGFPSVIGVAVLFAGCASALPRPGWPSGDSSTSSNPSSWGSSSDGSSSSSGSSVGSGSSNYGSPSASSNYGSSAGSGSSNNGSSVGSGSSNYGSSGYGSSDTGDSWGSSTALSDVMSSATVMASETVMSSVAAATETMTESALSSYVMWTQTASATETILSSAAMATDTTWTSSVSVAAATSTSVSYGSGSTNWGGDGYSNCVQQCVASYAPSASATITAYATDSASATSTGTGTTHTVVVAPTQGVLRFVPFAVNATPGDTVLYMWGANNHTVTKSTELTPCNETTDGTAFNTGEQDEGFTFTQVANDTDPVFYYCGTPGHCPKGMFGIINAPDVENNANTSVASMMPAMLANSSTLSAMYAASNVSSNPMAATWGDNLSMGTMPDWAQSLFAENVMYTRAFLAANPSVMQADGTIDMSAASGQFNVPQDISQTLSGASSSSSVASSTATGTAAAGLASGSSSSASANPSTTGATSGARANVASGALFGVAAIAATFLAL